MTVEKEPWQALALTADDVLHMPKIGIEVPVGECYEGVILGGDVAEDE